MLGMKHPSILIEYFLILGFQFTEHVVSVKLKRNNRREGESSEGNEQTRLDDLIPQTLIPQAEHGRISLHLPKPARILLHRSLGYSARGGNESLRWDDLINLPVPLNSAGKFPRR